MTFPRLVPPLVMSPGTDLIMTSQAEVMRIPELAATIEDHHWLTTYGLPIARTISCGASALTSAGGELPT